MSLISFEELTGRSESHLVAWDNGILVHRDVREPLLQLREHARAEGLEIAVASGYRGFDRQLSIWRDKVAGRRPLYGNDGQLLSRESMSTADVLRAILRWSALPGLSRHHWGTDFDIFDAGAVESDYRLQLTLDEYTEGGPFAALSEWLQAAAAELGFFRPYAEDLGGVAPEPWHVSYRPLADEFARLVDFEIFQRLLAENCWPLGEEIRRCADDIYRRYVCNLPAEDGTFSS